MRFFKTRVQDNIEHHIDLIQVTSYVHKFTKTIWRLFVWKFLTFCKLLLILIFIASTKIRLSIVIVNIFIQRTFNLATLIWYLLGMVRNLTEKDVDLETRNGICIALVDSSWCFPLSKNSTLDQTSYKWIMLKLIEIC